MLLDKLAEYLDQAEADFYYIKDDPRMEIWIKGREWFPILISKVNNQRHIVSWGGIDYDIEDMDKAYQLVLRICWSIKEGKKGS